MEHPPVPAASSRTGRSDHLSNLRYLTPRDRLLMSWLAEHYLLSVDQITRALFPSGRAARLRLTRLHRLGALDRFVDTTTGSQQYLYALGPLGFLLHRTVYNDPDNPAARAPRSNRERVHRIVGSQNLHHLLGVNDFFTRLLAHTRTHPHTRLDRWWSEQHGTDAYGTAGVRPDGHGIWSHDTTTVGFFLEHDRGTEPLHRVLGKLRAYERLTQFGPTYPVLLWLPTRRREANLVEALTGVPAAMPVATAVHVDDPAGPVWALTSDPAHRRRLHELPSDHGPIAATNPNRFVPRDLATGSQLMA
jgi:hypothetical protein